MVNAGSARMPAIAAWPIVRPVPSQRNVSVSALSKLSSMLSRLRCERWSPGGNTVSRVIRPDSVSDACGTREMRPTRPSATAGSAANVRPGSCSSTLNTVCSDTIGRSRSASSPSSTQPIAGPSATPSSRILPSARNFSSSSHSVVVEDRLDARVVELVEVDVVGAEPAQRRLELLADRRRLPVVRALRLARVLARGVDVVAALRGEHDLVALRLEHVGEQLLADAVLAVDGRGVDEVDAGVERGVQQALLVVDDAPPVTGERPDAEPDLGDLEVAPTEAAVAHGGSFRPVAFAIAGEIYCRRAGWLPTGTPGLRLAVLAFGGAEPVAQHDRDREHDARGDQRDHGDGHQRRSGTRRSRPTTNATTASSSRA